MATSQQARIVKEMEAVRHQVGDALSGILKDVNRERLKNKGKLTAAPKAERNSLRWTLEWKDGDINYDLNVVVVVEDDGIQARVGRVWVQRHASTPLEFDGHTPTTRIRRMTLLSLAEIRQAIEAEWG